MVLTMSHMPEVGETLVFYEPQGEGYSRIGRGEVIETKPATGTVLLEFRDKTRLWAKFYKQPWSTWDGRTNKSIKTHWRLLNGL